VRAFARQELSLGEQWSHPSLPASTDEAWISGENLKRTVSCTLKDAPARPTVDMHKPRVGPDKTARVNAGTAFVSGGR
jgi:hypothetical protein